jgi:hypothetical protein
VGSHFPQPLRFRFSRCYPSYELTHLDPLVFRQYDVTFALLKRGLSMDNGILHTRIYEGHNDYPTLCWNGCPQRKK